MKIKISALIIAITAIMTSSTIQAQEQTATLQHNDLLTVFTGVYSLTSAYNAAVNGDIIYLSPGTFSSVSYIEKSITIRGCGQRTDTNLAIRETFISGNTRIGDNQRININGLALEGLNMNSIDCYVGNIENLNIRHCSIKNMNLQVNPSSTPNYINVFIEHCVIGSFRAPSNYTNFVFTCCQIGSLEAYSKNISNTMAITNCYLDLNNNNSCNVVCQFNNCIIAGTKKPNSSCTAYNCIVPEGLLSDLLDKEGNYEVSDVNSLFVEDYTTDANFYKLTDDAATTYLGQDGTQVGLYGGQRPYTPVPSYPRVVEKSIAGQTTADGKLRVYIKAEAQKK